MRYSGYPPEPDHEEFRCKICTDDHGPLFAQAHISQTEAGVFSSDPGLDAAEEIEMAYENIQGEAERAIKGKRRPKAA